MEPIIDTILQSDSTKSFISKVVNSVAQKATSHIMQIVQNRILEYTVETARKCSYLRTILHKENIPIDEIYYPLGIKNYGKTIIPKSAKDIFSENSKVVIVGKGGSGKSTFLKYYFINSVKDSYKIPIFINFRQFNEIDLSENKKRKEIINNIFYKEIVSHLLFQKVGIETDFVLSLFESGNMLFILDGYDELNYSIKSYLLNNLDEFIIRFPDNNYLITTRPYTDVTHLTNFTTYELCGLNVKNDFRLFIQKQLFNNKELAENIHDTLLKDSSEKYLPLLTNPLFFTLFINSYESYPKLPPKKSEFYWQVFDALYEKHETFSKATYVRPRLTMLKREEFEFVLYAFSFVSYFQSKFNFKKRYFEETLVEIKKSYHISFEIQSFIEDLKVTLSILVDEGNELLFIHRTLQEYFAAKFITSLNNTIKNDFFLKLSEKQVKSSEHNFLLEILSELFPIEYTQNYLPAHYKLFLTSFRGTYILSLPHEIAIEEIDKAFTNLIELTSYSNDFNEFIRTFLNTNRDKYNEFHPILKILGTPSVQKWSKYKHMLILFYNQEKFEDSLEQFLKKKDDTVKPFIDFALYPNTKYPQQL
ncbi:MAG: NACHT domain-containing protein [Chitinophagales bacterium]|nr:NACHT domain-containing protein [Sphingobacteriales bacterium]